ncbi:hypothetical protein FMK90_25610 [Klebsiella grimontii]|jgi:hypothetical protein|uniref:Uncharacterized protein n=1 Tax=Salmonella enterica subsp. enterica serovar Sanjuan TaxID=1160765 RepID=A0A3S4FET7_SALET|nr:hypothetical protein T655_03720 [Klebsiella oxytoca G54]MBX4506641.1 hypothetical protein [Klebsiella oxytoca]MBZ7368185.1 hypothetical protein [Klebsiella grimontii]VEA04346.1 Uncharacterised protein [Salmonella enterica subsp. enterica serovar Sanjuan]MBZ7200021.1 hypothetical protein [Klebsiella oxytoca]
MTGVSVWGSGNGDKQLWLILLSLLSPLVACFCELSGFQDERMRGNSALSMRCSAVGFAEGDSLQFVQISYHMIL